jgi:DNA-binding transcriptional LysR family regulator
MYPAIKQALEGLRASLAEVGGFDPTRSQRSFRIVIPHPLGPFYALDLKAAAAVVAPGIELAFETVSRPIGLEDRLRDGNADLAVDWLPAELDSFINKNLFDDQLILIARRDHPSVCRGVTIEDLRKEKFVTLHARRDVQRRPVVIRELSSLGMLEEVHVSELLEIPTVVASTDLLGIMPLSIGPLLEKRLGLQVLSPSLELPTVPIYMIWHETRRNDTAHRWLRELVDAELGRQSPLTDEGS